MAGFQTAGLMVSDHPVLYGTTLAISLVGGVAALSPGVISVPVARVGYVLNLAENAPAGVSNSPVMNAAEPVAAADRVVSDRVEMPVVEAPVVETLVQMPSVPAAAPLRKMPIALEAAQHRVVLNLANDGVATRPQEQLTPAPQTNPAPAIAAVSAPQRALPLAAPKGAEIAALPSENFMAAFQSIPNPSLAVAAERPAAVQTDGPAVSNLSALTPPAAKPDQGFADQPKVTLAPVAVAAPVLVEPPSKPIELSTASPALVQTQARVSDAVIAPAPLNANLPAMSRTLSVASSLQQAGTKPAPSAQPLRLISSPQLRKFDLARIHAPARTTTAALSPATAKSSQASKVRTAGVKDRVIEGVVFHPIMVSVAGSSPKRLDVRIGADLRPSIKVGDLLGLVSDRMDPASSNRFASAASAKEYVSLAALRASGFNVVYNAGTDSISITAAD